MHDRTLVSCWWISFAWCLELSSLSSEEARGALRGRALGNLSLVLDARGSLVTQSYSGAGASTLCSSWWFLVWPSKDKLLKGRVAKGIPSKGLVEVSETCQSVPLYEGCYAFLHRRRLLLHLTPFLWSRLSMGLRCHLHYFHLGSIGLDFKHLFRGLSSGGDNLQAHG